MKKIFVLVVSLFVFCNFVIAENITREKTFYSNFDTVTDKIEKNLSKYYKKDLKIRNSISNGKKGGHASINWDTIYDANNENPQRDKFKIFVREVSKNITNVKLFYEFEYTSRKAKAYVKPGKEAMIGYYNEIWAVMEADNPSSVKEKQYKNIVNGKAVEEKADKKEKKEKNSKNKNNKSEGIAIVSDVTEKEDDSKVETKQISSDIKKSSSGDKDFGKAEKTEDLAKEETESGNQQAVDAIVPIVQPEQGEEIVEDKKDEQIEEKSTTEKIKESVKAAEDAVENSPVIGQIKDNADTAVEVEQTMEKSEMETEEESIEKEEPKQEESSVALALALQTAPAIEEPKQEISEDIKPAAADDLELKKLQKQEELRKQKEEQAAKREELRKQKEETKKQKEAELAALKQQKEEEAAQKLKEKEEAKKQKEANLVALKLQKEEARKKKEEEAAQKLKEKEEAKKQKEAELAALRIQKEEEAKKKKEEFEAKKLQEEEALKQQKEVELDALKAKEEEEAKIQEQILAEQKLQEEKQKQQDLEDLKKAKTRTYNLSYYKVYSTMFDNLSRNVKSIQSADEEKGEIVTDWTYSGNALQSHKAKRRFKITLRFTEISDNQTQVLADTQFQTYLIEWKDQVLKDKFLADYYKSLFTDLEDGL